MRYFTQFDRIIRSNQTVIVCIWIVFRTALIPISCHDVSQHFRPSRDTPRFLRPCDVSDRLHARHEVFADFTRTYVNPYQDVGCDSFFKFKHSGYGVGCVLVGSDISSVECESWIFNGTTTGFGQPCHNRFSSQLYSDGFGHIRGSEFESCFGGFDVNCTRSNELRSRWRVPLADCQELTEEVQLRNGSNTGQVNLDCWETDRRGRRTTDGGDWLRTCWRHNPFPELVTEGEAAGLYI